MCVGSRERSRREIIHSALGEEEMKTPRKKYFPEKENLNPPFYERKRRQIIALVSIGGRRRKKRRNQMVF